MIEKYSSSLLKFNDLFDNHVKKYYIKPKSKVGWMSFQVNVSTTIDYIIANTIDKAVFVGQHGIGYGMDEIHSLEKYERSISDLYFTYGWTEDLKTKSLALRN